MTAVAGSFLQQDRPGDVLSGAQRANAIDRWIFVFMAAWFIAITLTGFIPDAIMKIGMVKAGARPPFPIVMHMHAVLMGSFLLLLLAQTWLMATGRRQLHMQLGVAAFVLAPVLVIVGFVLAPTMYHQTWNGLASAAPPVRPRLEAVLSFQENILLRQISAGILFPLFLAIGLWAPRSDAGLHKRLMILATAVPLGAAIDRIDWLPSTMPAAVVSQDLYILLAVSPMFAWDVIRNRNIHRAWWLWLAGYLPAAVVINVLWDTPGWHAAARHIMGV